MSMSKVRILAIKPLMAREGEIPHRGLMRAIRFFRDHFYVDLYSAKVLTDNLPRDLEITDSMLEDLDEAFIWEAI